MSSLLLALPIRGEVDNDRMDFDLQGVEYVPAEWNVIPCRFEEEVHEIVSALAVVDIVSRSLVDEVEPVPMCGTSAPDARSRDGRHPVLHR